MSSPLDSLSQSSSALGSPAAYDFVAPRKIVFGWGRRRELPGVLAPLARRVWVVNGSHTLERSGVLDELRSEVQRQGIEWLPLTTLGHEPEVDDVDQATARLRANGVQSHDAVLAIGGGSAIDLAKAVAALAPQSGAASVLDYLEGVGRGLQLAADPLPLVAMPTTAGTGSEATKNAVISSYDPAYKKSLRHDRMMAAAVLVDPELTVSLPRSATIATGMDALTQLIESYISRRTRPLPQALVEQALPLTLAALPRAAADGADRPAREAMAHAALVSGLALANSGLGAAHGVAAALGSQHRVTHGLACAAMLPAALRINRPVCAAALARLERLASPTETCGDDDQAADAFVARIENLARSLGVPQRLRELGVPREALPALADGSRGNSLDGNPVQLDVPQLTALLEGIW